MKTIIAFLLSLIAVFGLYPQTAQIVEIDRETDTITVETATGMLFAFSGSEDYDEGDYVSIIFYSNGTEEVTDDIILNVRYSGYHG